MTRERSPARHPSSVRRRLPVHPASWPHEPTRDSSSAGPRARRRYRGGVRAHRSPGEEAAPACACDAGPSIGDYFDRKVRSASPAASPTLHATSRAILDLLGPLEGTTLLELGTGRGGLLLEALRSGASAVSGVDLSTASIEAARQRVAAAGLGERATLTVGDGARIELVPHDSVVLDRVICCYPAADALVANASRAARSRMAFSVPDSRGWRGGLARLALALENAWHRLRGASCRTFVHDLDRIEAALTTAGFQLVARTNRGLWYIAAFERTSAPASQNPAPAE